MKDYYSWSDLKNLSNIKHIPLQYCETPTKYEIFIIEEGQKYFTEIFKITSTVKGIDEEQNISDREDFEDNYKNLANTPSKPRSEDSKEIVRAESRPLDCTTVFTSRGDSDTEIGEGKILSWDFSNDDDIVEMPSGSGMKRKRIEFKFLDDIYLKDGAVYFFNTKKGSYGDVYVVCPAGQYYLKNDGTPAIATEDTIVAYYMVHMMIQGDCPMGDEFNTEACSEKLPKNYKFRIDITVPEDDNNSNGYINLEIFRKRTVIL